MRFALFLVFLVPSAAFAQDKVWKDPGLEKALATARRITEVTEPDDSGYKAYLSAWIRMCGSKSSEANCRLHECDLGDQAGCRKDHVLLFRGEEEPYPLPATSALVRSRILGSDYGFGIPVESLLDILSSDFGILKSFDYAPQSEPVLLVINSKTGAREWQWKDTREKIVPYDHRTSPRSAALTAYSFHVEASTLYYRDDSRRETTGIDPLISLSANPNTAQAFAESGRVMVFSIPETALVPLCSASSTLKAGTVLDPKACTEPLNEHSDEQELDAVLYLKESFVARAFTIRH